MTEYKKAVQQEIQKAKSKAKSKAELKAEYDSGADLRQAAGMMGNQAVLQRTLVPFNDHEYVSDQYNSMNELAKIRMDIAGYVVDLHVMNAYRLFNAKNYEDAAPGYVENYQRTNSAASIGYVIESIAINRMIKNGFENKFDFQWHSGNGRPDVKFERDGYIGIVDITSDGQSGHVLNKDIEWDTISYVAESQYPTYSGMVSKILREKRLDTMSYIPSENDSDTEE